MNYEKEWLICCWNINCINTKKLNIIDIGKDLRCEKCGDILVDKNKVRLKISKKSIKNDKATNEFFEELWKLTPSKTSLKKGKSSVKISQRRKLEKIGLEKLKNAILLYLKDKDLKINGGYAALLHGSTFFNTRYKDYLDVDESTQEKKKIEFIETDL